MQTETCKETQSVVFTQEFKAQQRMDFKIKVRYYFHKRNMNWEIDKTACRGTYVAQYLDVIGLVWLLPIALIN